jgi:hypothetical protein
LGAQRNFASGNLCSLAGEPRHPYQSSGIFLRRPRDVQERSCPLVGHRTRALTRQPFLNHGAYEVKSSRWRRDGNDWILMCGGRRFGRVYRDGKWPGMWRSTLPNGRPSDMANLSWAKNAVLVMAERELDWEDRHRSRACLNTLVFGQKTGCFLERGLAGAFLGGGS